MSKTAPKAEVKAISTKSWHESSLGSAISSFSETAVRFSLLKHTDSISWALLWIFFSYSSRWSIRMCLESSVDETPMYVLKSALSLKTGNVLPFWLRLKGNSVTATSPSLDQSIPSDKAWPIFPFKPAIITEYSSLLQQYVTGT